MYVDILTPTYMEPSSLNPRLKDKKPVAPHIIGRSGYKILCASSMALSDFFSLILCILWYNLRSCLPYVYRGSILSYHSYEFSF